MLQGKCLYPDILPTYETFYLFPDGNDLVYASRFPRKGAHTGCYEKKHFDIKEINETSERKPEPPKRTDSIECQAIYSAKLIWCWEHSKEMVGKTYFVIARGSGTHVDVYETEDLKGMLACYPIHWFENFDSPEEPVFFEQMKLF